MVFGRLGSLLTGTALGLGTTTEGRAMRRLMNAALIALGLLAGSAMIVPGQATMPNMTAGPGVATAEGMLHPVQYRRRYAPPPRGYYAPPPRRYYRQGYAPPPRAYRRPYAPRPRYAPPPRPYYRR